MISQIIEIAGDKFRIDTYHWGDRIDTRFFSSLDTPADQYQEFSMGGWMEGDYFHIFEGITFRGAAFDPAIREGKLKPGQTFDHVVNQIRQKFVDRGMGDLVPEYVAEHLRWKLSQALISISPAPLSAGMQLAVDSIHEEALKILKERANGN